MGCKIQVENKFHQRNLIRENIEIVFLLLFSVDSFENQNKLFLYADFHLCWLI